MTQTLRPTVLLILAAVAAVPLQADTGREGLVAPAEARRYGLERAWFTQVQLDPARGSVQNIQYYVSSAESYTLYEVRYQNRKRNFTERDLNAFGEVLGKEGAKKVAEEFVADLKKQGVEGTLETVEVPETTLFVTTDRGVVHAIDGENGQTRWSTLYGNENHPTERPGVNERFVAVLNGTTLYLVKRKTGEVAWSRKVRGVPGAGPVITDAFVVVPTVTGGVELYDIKETRTLPQLYHCNGRIIVQPIASPQSVAWPTDRGFLYVASSRRRTMRFRLEAKDTIVSQASYFGPNRIFSASIDGYVYCVHEISGNEFWRFSAGEPISQTPVPTGESLYVITDKGNMFCLNQETGAEQWVSPQVGQFVAASKQRLYCLGATWKLAILDAKTGSRIATLNTDLLDLYYTNLRTDRIFVGSKTGVIQCLREAQMDWPLVHAGLEKPEDEEKKPGEQPEEEAEGKAGKKKSEKPAAEKAGPGDKDPFAAGADPFAAKPGKAKAAKPAAEKKAEKAEPGDKDPFAGGADPADPFAAKPAKAPPAKPAAKPADDAGAPPKPDAKGKKDDDDPFR